MTDLSMADAIVPKSDQINADDLISGPRTITIREVQIRGGQEQPVSIYFDGSDKAFRPCKSMSRVLVAAWGPNAKVYVGRSLTLFRDPTVKWAGMEVGGIRISHMTHIDGKLTMALTATKGQRKPHVVMPLVAEVKQHPTADPKPQTAADWAEAHRAEVLKVASAEELAQIKAKSARFIAKLAATDADLHSRVMETYELRTQELATPTPDQTDEAFWEQGEQA
jgi:hypothetical protein